MKKNIIKLISSLFLMIISIIFLLFCNSAEKIKNVDITIDKYKEDERVYVTLLSINDNEYLMDNYLLYDEELEKYYYNDEIFFSITDNDSFKIIAEEDNIDAMSVVVDGKEVETYYDKETNTYSYVSTVSKKDVLKSSYRDYGLFRILFYSVLFFAFYYGILCLIQIFLDKLFNDKFDIKYFLLSLVGLFAIMYFNMRTIMNIFGVGSIIFVIVPLAYLIWKYRKSKRFNLENSYLLISLVLGLSFMFILPPFMVSDEDNHFMSVYDKFFLSNEKVLIDEDDRPYILVSHNVLDFVDKYQTYKLSSDTYFSSMHFYEDYVTLINKDNKSQTHVSYGTMFANKLAYIPSNIVTTICKTVNTNLYLMYMLARFVNYLIFLLITYLALKLIPKYKYILFVILTFGILYQQAVGINRDWLNDACLAMLFSYIFYLIFEKKKVEAKDYAILGLLNIGLAFSKSIYTLFTCLVLLIPNDKFGNYKKKYKVFNSSMLKKVLIIGVAGTLAIISKMLPSFREVGSTLVTTEYYTVGYFLHNPVSFVSIVVKTIISRGSLDFIRGYYDGFGWSTIWHFDLIGYVLFGLYLVIILTQPKEKFESKKQELMFKGLNLLLMIGISIAISYPMLFGWTTFGGKYIDGLQPRYYLPAIFALYVCLDNKKFKLDIKNRELFLTIVISAINVVCLGTIMFFYYV